MDNAKQIRRIHNIFGSLKAKYGKEDDIRNTLNAMMKDHEEELMPKPQPPPLKLEAGCRVKPMMHLSAEVVYIDGSNVCVKFLETRNFQIFFARTLTVTEAATPGVNDYVELDPAWGFPPNVRRIIANIKPKEHEDSPWLYGCRWHGSMRYFQRDDFTILHKAPKE